MRILLDSNVVFSGVLWTGATHRLLQILSQREDITLWTSPKLLGELFEILVRPSKAKYLTKIDTTPSQVLADYMAIVHIVEPKTVPHIIPNDPDDDHVLAAAVTANADLIISGDEDLINLANYQGINIVTVNQAMLIVSS
jgi:uncharacterized protein